MSKTSSLPQNGGILGKKEESEAEDLEDLDDRTANAPSPVSNKGFYT